jgi:Methyltransferase domain
MNVRGLPRKGSDGRRIRRPSLDRLAHRHKTDKRSGRHGYAEMYDNALQSRRDDALKLLEIGIHRGSSLRMWADYFPQGEIHGIDIVESARQHAAERIKVHIGDASQQEVLAPIVAEVGAFDVIIDDGSHRYEHQYPSLMALWPHLAPGGVYAIEDLGTSYRKKYGMGYRKPESTVELLKSLLDDVHHSVHGHPPLLDGIAEVHVHHELALLVKSA